MTISFRSATTEDGGTPIDAPAGAADGDMLLWAAVVDSSSATFTPDAPGGGGSWAELSGSPIASTLDGQRLRVFTRTRVSGDGSSYGWTQSATHICALLAFSTTNGPIAVNVSSANPGSGSTTSPTTATGTGVTTTLTNTRLVWAATVDNTASAAPAVNALPGGMTSRASVTLGSFLTLVVADEAVAALGATGDRAGTFTHGGNGRGMAFLIALSDADSAAGGGGGLRKIIQQLGGG